jgi:UDP-N-acetylmuramoylalanine--D-glutamate ligase
MSSRLVAIIGFGVTGRATARALLAAGDRVVVFDDNWPPSASGAAPTADLAAGVDVELTPTGSTLVDRLGACDLIIPSPGVPVGHPVFAAAGTAHVPVVAEIEVAAQMAARAGGPRLVAITGTNGKTTVTTLVTSILQASGCRAVAAGNIGLPAIEAVWTDAEVVVAEVSSFQLQFTEGFRPAVSCWLNFAPDHLDWHPSLDHYADAKSRVWARQGVGDTAVVNLDDPVVRSAGGRISPDVELVTFSLGQAAEYRVDGYRLTGPPGASLVMPVDQLPRAFPHDLSNALAATAVAEAAGGTRAACRQALAATAPLPHRVSLIGEWDGVGWYDDSKATTPASVQAAVAGFSSVVLIAGGRNKGLDLRVLARTVPPVRAVVAIGEAAPDIQAAFAGRVPVAAAAGMEAAVEAAAELARAGDSVVLSPGCASFDWYRSYAARGDHFVAIVTSRFEREGRPC